MYDRMLIAIDTALDSPDNSMRRAIQFARMSGGTVHLLHVARGHVVASDISAGSGLGVLPGEDDVDVHEREIVQRAVDESWSTPRNTMRRRSSSSGRGTCRSTSSCWATSTTGARRSPTR